MSTSRHGHEWSVRKDVPVGGGFRKIEIAVDAGLKVFVNNAAEF